MATTPFDPYLIPPTDVKGHSAQIVCHVQPGHARMVEVILASKQFPFATKGDVMRWCLHYGLEQLVSLSKEDSVAHSQFAQVRAVVELIKQEAAHHEFLTTFSLLKRVIEQHISVGAVTEAQRLVAQLEHTMSRMPDGYWRTRYIAELQAQWSYLTNADSGAPLTPEGE